MISIVYVDVQFAITCRQTVSAVKNTIPFTILASVEGIAFFDCKSV